ncbi:hypothetical protein Pryu01_01137 [Paraliobacillus ryukyuensis]|uniref:Putative membrane protein n=1 Tax=Paraliobacillus ryukyuensis TaxID=200904 RepID=A0A366ED16_9BACI|nr:hypothetical protein [Paraliobacillus ryukyuensis]RBP00291.1 putative membrane protein [Paraliobacillus ryukyuensis]
MNDLETNTTHTNDVQENKLVAILGYILFFIPLLAAKDSAFARYHANQGLILLLTSIAVNIIGAIIPIIGVFIIIPIASIVIFVFFILGIVNAANGQMKPLPLIGGIEIIK